MKKVVLSLCTNCKATIAPHRACKQCGHYAGRAVVDTARAAKRLVKKARAVAPKPEAHDHKEDEKKA